MTAHALSPLGTADRPSSACALTPEEIREFRDLVASETGVDLSVQEASDRAIELVALVRMLLSTIPEDR